jgi:hypothetical protein
MFDDHLKHKEEFQKFRWLDLLRIFPSLLKAASSFFIFRYMIFIGLAGLLAVGIGVLQHYVAGNSSLTLLAWPLLIVTFEINYQKKNKN